MASFTDPDEARRYLNSLSDHPNRSGDTSKLNPQFAVSMANAIADARAAGMPVRLLSGQREGSVTGSKYDTAGFSSHIYGLASDVAGIGPAGSSTASQWRQIAQANGLSSPYNPNGSEWNHWQIGPKLEDDPQLLKRLQAAHASGDTTAMWNAFAPTTSVAASFAPYKIAGAMQPPPSGGFLRSLGQIESNNQNIFSGVDKDYPGQPGSRSQGYYQIDTPTWQQFAVKAGIDTNKYPNAMSAPPDVQAQVASLIPLSRFGGRTQRMLGQQFGQLDTSKTVGQLSQQYGGANAQGTTLTSNAITSPHTLTPSTAGAPYTPAAVAAANQPPAPQNTGNIVQQAFARPPSTAVDKDGNPVPTQSPAEKVANAVGGLAKSAGMGAQTAAAPADSTPMLPASQDSSGAMAQAGQQVLTAAIQAGAKPLSWSSRPYGSGIAGRQVPGMTLNQSGYYG